MKMVPLEQPTQLALEMELSVQPTQLALEMVPSVQASERRSRRRSNRSMPQAAVGLQTLRAKEFWPKLLEEATQLAQASGAVGVGAEAVGRGNPACAEDALVGANCCVVVGTEAVGRGNPACAEDALVGASGLENVEVERTKSQRFVVGEGLVVSDAKLGAKDSSAPISSSSQSATKSSASPR